MECWPALVSGSQPTPLRVRYDVAMSIFNEDFGFIMSTMSLTLNVEPLAQTWIKCECFYFKVHID
jgi:hypothetical protein